MGFHLQLELMDEVELKRKVRLDARHYVYVLCRPSGDPFYVGKGLRDRALHHVAEARTTKRLNHKLNLIRSLLRSGLQVRYALDSFHDEEKAAHARERELILAVGRHDLGTGPLTNQTEGGEGAANPSEEVRERRRQTLWGQGGDDPDRVIANRYFQALCDVQSVPIKPLSKYKTEGVWKNRDQLAMTARQAAALAASAISNRVLICPGAEIPRQMSVEGCPMIIENGVGRDILSSGMAALGRSSEGSETLILSEAGARFIPAVLRSSLLVDAGVLEPGYANWASG